MLEHLKFRKSSSKIIRRRRAAVPQAEQSVNGGGFSGIVGSDKAVFYQIAPMPAPRQTRRDKWHPRPVVVRYREWCDEIRGLGVMLPIPAKVTFFVKIPKSWSKRDRAAMHLHPHESERGDKDNFEKALLDALFAKDGHVWSLWPEKRWSLTPGILIEPLSTAAVYRCDLCGGKQLGSEPAFCNREGCKQPHRASGIMRREDTP